MTLVQDSELTSQAVARVPRVAFLVNGSIESAMGERARSLAARLAPQFHIPIAYRSGRKGLAAWKFYEQLRAHKPDVCCCFDMAVDGVLAGAWYRCRYGCPLIVDTGDDIVALGQALGRGVCARAATRWLEWLAVRSAAVVTVRGRFHQENLLARGIECHFVPDGVSVDDFHPSEGERPPQPDAVHPLVIGVLGSCVWSPVRQGCYGQELVELLALLRPTSPVPVRGVFIGDGNGLPRLKARAAELGVYDLLEFTGRLPLNALPAQLHQWHIALSTQTNDAVGRVRTTGKLPLYLAAGRFILASRVGEASRLLPEEMLVDFAGSRDTSYASKLQQRILELLTQDQDWRYRPECVALAKSHFEYDLLATRYQAILSQVLSGRRSPAFRSPQ